MELLSYELRYRPTVVPNVKPLLGSDNVSLALVAVVSRLPQTLDAAISHPKSNGPVFVLDEPRIEDDVHNFTMSSTKHRTHEQH